MCQETGSDEQPGVEGLQWRPGQIALWLPTMIYGE